MTAKVGSFAKSTDAAPVSQAITGVGFIPEVLILWTMGGTVAGTWRNAYHYSIGMATSASDVAAISHSADDNAATSNVGQAARAKVMAIVNGSQSVLAECDLSSLDSDGFTVNWTTNDSNAYIIHYMALAGPDLTNAKLAPYRTDATPYSVTGVGFQPTLLFAISNNGLPTDVPNTAAGYAMCVGWASSSLTTDQAYNTYTSQDAQAAGQTYHANVNSAVVNARNVNGTTFFNQAFSSFDADGFTVTRFSDGAAIGLCLAGVSFKIGIFTKTTDAAPATQAITGVGFVPDAVIFMTMPSTGATSGRATFGIATAANSHGSLLQDQDEADPTNTSAIDKTDKCLVLGDNDTQTIGAEASLTSMDADGFTLTWSTNSAATPTIRYLALKAGDALAGQPVALRDWVKHVGRPWRPGRGL